MTDAVLRKCVTAALGVALAALNACTYWHGDLERIVDQSERDFRRDPSRVYTPVPLQTVLANPTGYKYNDVRFEAILNHVGEKAFVPYWTTFDSEDYVSFSLWPAEAKLWQSDDRRASHPLFFLHKDNPSIGDLFTAGRFSLVRISGQVRGDFELKAWFNVTRVEVLEPNVYSESALADLALAKEAMADKKPAVAIRHYEGALSGIWTASLRLEIHLTLAHLYEGRGDLQSALNHFRGALLNAPENEDAKKGVERCETGLAGKEAPAQQ